MSHKIILFIVTLCLSFFPNYLNANFENQGFSSFIESDNGITFDCEKTCYILVGDLASNDKVDFDGKFTGNGVFAYGFLVGEQFAQGDIIQVNNNDLIKTFDFHKLQFFSELPKESKTMFIIEGKISGKINNIKLSQNTFSESVVKLGTDFLTVEGIMPYSINLRYGTMIFGVSIVKIFYIVFVLGLLVLLILSKLDIRNSMYLALTLFLIIGFKNLYDYSHIYFGGVKSYYMAEDGNKSFYNMQDYYEFTDKSRKAMGIDKSSDQNSCKYFAKCVSDWPYCFYWRVDFMFPCKLTDKVEESNFILLFKQDIPTEFKSKKVLVEQNQNYLLKN